jgi:signal transduction histidine kinase
MVAALLLGNLRDEFQARIGLAVVIGCAAVVTYNDPSTTTGNLVFVPALFAIAWVAGFAMRERAAEAEAAEKRADEAEREREVTARIAVAEERARIARELHDIVAHAVSVMVLQIGAVRHKLPESVREDKDALKNVEDAGRTALNEMRRLLGAMRNESDDLELAPQPGLDSLDSLLAAVRDSGLPVQLRVEGEPVPLTRALDLSAYRIIQESLTNVLKHAHASHADVAIRYGQSDLRIDVRDDGTGAPARLGIGHGLVGIGERVKIYGGELTTGSRNGGGFIISARLPLDSAES